MMGGGWSRYTSGASSGRGTGCWFSIVAAILTIMALALLFSFIGGPDEW